MLGLVWLWIGIGLCGDPVWELTDTVIIPIPKQPRLKEYDDAQQKAFRCGICKNLIEEVTKSTQDKLKNTRYSSKDAAILESLENYIRDEHLKHYIDGEGIAIPGYPGKLVSPIDKKDILRHLSNFYEEEINSGIYKNHTPEKICTSIKMCLPE